MINTSHALARYFSILCLLSIFLFSCEQEEEASAQELLRQGCSEGHYYYGGDDKIQLNELLLGDYLAVGFDKSVSNAAILTFVNGHAAFMQIDETAIVDRDTDTYKRVMLNLRESKSCTGLQQLIDALLDVEEVAFASFVYDLGFGNEFTWYELMSYHDEFMVEVKDAADLSALHAVIAETKTTIKRPYEYNARWFVLSAPKSAMGNALQMANYFYETGLFSNAHPNFFFSSLTGVSGGDPCSDRVPVEDCDAAFTRWFYDNTTKSCREIAYSGCSERGFANRQACEACASNQTP